MQTGKITALYVRFSYDDGIDAESGSIEHQKSLLRSYAESNGFTNLSYYADDGYTGTNFNRPDFQRMLGDIQKGLVSTVIVKDMSRFCRNYLEVGFYTEILFPKKQIRFIAINNSVDSDKPQDNDFTPFLNIMNEWYAKDTSNKISRTRSGGKSRHRNGEAERRFQISPDRRYKQPCTVDCPAVCQRRCSHRHNDCQQKEKVQQIIE